ncbi:hypothetical protein MetMK1DRAFT_00006300 [Metallosphaera yellowstonensis MK1]|jgi:hypothetical protein|uniref:Uncharacterized protein n=1 Tax=Metallosphaera yellowstonensis MK1 TaxID=671065 RepID=H2C1K7_9CREN|nr:hypothetical protein [Metallosphaera yellowstonensis]EHP70128.1 hypothetical protein MetMK1DRAFT_00006300 [Metallosphaera yellowstonensis MK1]
MIGPAPEVLGVMKVDGRVTVFSSTGFNDLRVTCLPSRGVARGVSRNEGESYPR